VGGPVSPAIRGSAAYVVIWRGLCGGGLPGAWALRLNWLLGISALMVTTGLGFSAAKASDRRCSCHQQGGEFGVRDTASEQTLGASVTSVIAAFAAGLALSACATAGT